MRRSKPAPLIALLTALALAGCNGGSAAGPGPVAADAAAAAPASTEQTAAAPEGGEPVKLKIMFGKNDAVTDHLYEWMIENVETYRQQHPHVEFDVIANASGDQYLTKITSEMAANNAPDVFQSWALERMRPFAEAGRLMDLTDMLEASPELKGFFQDDALGGTMFEGRVYGLPACMDITVVFYSKRTFAQYGVAPPDTYEQFLDIVDTLVENGVIPITLPNVEPWAGSIPYQNFVERLGGLDVAHSVIDGTVDWTSDPFVQGAEMLQALQARGAFEKDVNSTNFSEVNPKLVEGRAAMHMMGTWSLPGLLAELGDDLGFFNFPSIEGGAGSNRHYTVLPNVALAASSATKYPDEATDYLKHCFTQERQLAFAKRGFIVTTKVEAAEGDIDPFVLELLAALDTAEGTFYTFDSPLYMGQELNKTTQVFYMGEDPKPLLEQLQQKQEQHNSAQ